MKFNKNLFTICFCLIAMHYANAQVKLPQLIRDSMILQHDTKINIWGCGSSVKVLQLAKQYKGYS